MINAFIVLREEKHVDIKTWVCLAREDALKIARDVTDYWVEKYGVDLADKDGYDTTLYGDQLFHFQAEEFYVWVIPQDIREPGETAQEQTTK